MHAWRVASGIVLAGLMAAVAVFAALFLWRALPVLNAPSHGERLKLERTRNMDINIVRPVPPSQTPRDRIVTPPPTTPKKSKTTVVAG